MRFITEYIRINQQLGKKLDPLPRTGKTMQKLEGLQDATEFDLNMGY